MESTSRDVSRDALRVWRLPARGLMDYLIHVAATVSESDADRKIMEACRSAEEGELPPLRRLYTLMVGFGLRPDRPSHRMFASQFNFVRPTRVAPTLADSLRQDIGALEEVAAAYAQGSTLEERTILSVTQDFLGVRREALRVLDRVLLELRSQAGDAGAEVPPEEATEGDSGVPWHDESLGLDERMKLAEGKGLFEKLFAAMAQTDCTACGYDCEGYARAIADGDDGDLSKCAPGGPETEKMLKKLMSK